MKTPLLVSAVLLAACLPLRAQDYNDKDVKKAEKLAVEDKDFKSLPEDEKQAVILFIAAKIHGHRRRALEADIRTLKGAKVEEVKKKVSKSSIVIAEQDAEPVSIPGDTTLDVRPIETPPFGRLFADNNWTIDETEAKTLKQNIDKVVDTLKKGDGRIANMHVESSASTLRNTGKAASLTHLELSKRRAEAAAKYALDYLKTKGYTLDEDEQVTLDYEGGNKNGTTGASSPFAVAAKTPPELVAAGSCEAPEELKAAAAKGAAMSPADSAMIASYYDPNKFVRLTFDAVFETRGTTPGKTTPGQAHVVAATVDFKDPFRITLPRLHIRLPRLHLGALFGNSERRNARRAVRCPRFKS